jgi:glycosyltransferase involved in cell wall biosynthesis
MFSIVIPLYNKEKDISSTILSVLAQTYENYELIIVDDGSTDQSLDVVYGFNDSRIRVYSIQNVGVSTARNFGIDKASNKYVALLDADDTWDRYFLESMQKMISLFPDAALYGSAYTIVTKEKSIIVDYCFPQEYIGCIDNYFKIAVRNILFTSSSVVLNKVKFRSIGGFDSGLKKGEDLDLWIRMALHFPVAYYNIPLVEYRLNSQNRAMNQILAEEYSLIWSLDRYKEYESNNPDFKKFLDSWRLSHIKNYFEGNRKEVTDPEKLFSSIDLSNLSYFWRLMYYSPSLIRGQIYKIRKTFVKAVKRVTIL